ncbi:MAG: ABC transporter ATP-binding protein [Phycisphaerales bacterium]|nr:MAG: ABC transporter ATP-binding protein [Phycisphaerales bacterium]
MHDFWRFAKQMLRHRALLTAAVLAAFLSAGGLGVGIMALAPALKNILDDEGAPLPELVGSLSARAEAIIGVGAPAAWIDALPSDRFQSVLWIVLALCVLTVFGATANFLHAYWSVTLATRVVTGVRRDAFRSVVHLPMRSVLASGVNDIVSRIVNDTSKLNSGLMALVNKGPAQVTKGIAGFIAAVLVDWRSLGAIPVALLLGWIIRKLGKVVKRASRGAMKAQSQLLAVTNESMQGLRVVKTHTTERYETGRFSRFNRELMRQHLRARTAKAVSGPLLETIAIFVLGAWSLYYAKQIIDGDMEAANFFAALTGLAVAAGSLKPLSGIVQDIQSAAPAAQRIAELIDAESESSASSDGASRLPRLPRHAESIAFEDVRFSYPGSERPALDGVSVTIRHGETVAFVGANGSGKTTLISLVPRLFDPDEGRVLLDGLDIRAHHLRSLRRQIGVVTQEVVLFRGTIASNIAYGAENVSRERIVEAATFARAHEFITQKPGGYDAPVGEQGVTLSGGQRQRIAIARAYLRNPSILLLDEATSMIDADSEAQITGALAEFSKGRTCLVVAHRLSTVINADRIVVLHEGRVADVGRHAELLERCGVYRVLTANQLVGAPG